MGDIVRQRLAAPAPEPPKIDLNSIEKEWSAQKKQFERTMPSNHKIIYVIHEGSQFLQVEEANDVVAAILSVGRWTPVDLVLHTFGGSATACEMIAEALVHRPFTRAFVPFYALSAGTEIALATGQIIFGKHGALGPTDLHFGGISPKVLEQLEKEVGFENLPVGLQLLIIQTRGAIKRDIKKTCKLVNRRHKSMGDWLTGGCTLAQKLSSGDMPHDHRITYKEARGLGINARQRTLKKMYQLVTARRQQLKKIQELEDAIRVINAKGSKPVTLMTQKPTPATAA